MMSIHRRDKYLAQKLNFPTLFKIPCVCKMYLIFCLNLIQVDSEDLNLLFAYIPYMHDLPLKI